MAWFVGETLMLGKILAACVAATLTFLAVASNAHAGRLYGPRPGYAPAVQAGVYDSCWRYRVIATREGREVVRVWICGNYTTYGSDFDWGYGRSIADRADWHFYRW